MMWMNSRFGTTVRHFSRVSPPRTDCVLRVSSNNITHLGRPKSSHKPRQLLSLPPFPPHPPPGKNGPPDSRMTAISWMKYYFADVTASLIQSHFNKGLVKMECHDVMKKIKHNEVMKSGCKIYVAVSVAESRISRRFDTIPTASLCPNADEIQYLQRLVMYKDSALLLLNKPPKVPLKGNVAVHNSMDALAAAALCYDYDEGPKLVHRLDRESSGIVLMGRTKETISYLHCLFSHMNTPLVACSDGCEPTTYQRYWALVIGTPKEKQGLISAPLTKVVLIGGKAERVMLGYGSGVEDAVTEYRVLGPTINGCSWVELRPLTNHKHQMRVHCAEALGTPIVGDYKYGWFMHSRWKQMPTPDYEPTSGEPYRLRRPDGLDVQKGSVLSKVPLLHLHSRELVIPNVAKHLQGQNVNSKPDVLRFVAPMPSHMKISWNLMSSYLV